LKTYISCEIGKKEEEEEEEEEEERERERERKKERKQECDGSHTLSSNSRNKRRH